MEERESPKRSLEHGMRLGLRDKELAGPGADEADGRGGTAGQRVQPRRHLGGRRWVPVRAKRVSAVCGRPCPPRGIGGVCTCGCDHPRGHLGRGRPATSPHGGQGSEKTWEQQGP